MSFLRHYKFDPKIFNKNFPYFIAVIFFSVSFALVEAMVVVYLRQILATTIGDIFSNASQISTRATLFSFGAVSFLHPDVFSKWDTLHLEIFREMATMVMLLTVAFVAGRNLWERLGFYLLSFGVWDIFYYIWLFLFIGWPKSVFEMDILFLIPVPWVGPVWAPTTISLGMIATSIFLLGCVNRR